MAGVDADRVAISGGLRWGWPRRVAAVVVIALSMGLTPVFAREGTAGAANGPVKRIVALGDSYASGEGNPPFDVETVQPLDTCHRSAQAWPRLLGVSSTFLLACSGARTDALFRGQMTAAPDNVGQIERLRVINAEQPVDVVTLTIGGNNIDFSGILARCFEQVLASCLRHPANNHRDVDKLTANLQRNVLPAIKNAAPGAQIFVVGYPRLFPKNYADVTRCGWLARSEHDRALELQRYLDQQEAAAAKNAGATFVSVASVFNGHELCSGDPWIHAVTAKCVPATVPEGVAVDPASAYCGHPLAAGQQAIADVVFAHLFSRRGPDLDHDGLRDGFSASAQGWQVKLSSGGTFRVEGDGVFVAELEGWAELDDVPGDELIVHTGHISTYDIFEIYTLSPDLPTPAFVAAGTLYAYGGDGDSKWGFVCGRDHGGPFVEQIEFFDPSGTGAGPWERSATIYRWQGKRLVAQRSAPQTSVAAPTKSEIGVQCARPPRRHGAHTANGAGLFSRFAGTWKGPGVTITIDAAGHGRVDVPDVPVKATFILTSVDGSVAQGRTLSTDAPVVFGDGTFSASLLPGNQIDINDYTLSRR